MAETIVFQNAQAERYGVCEDGPFRANAKAQGFVAGEAAPSDTRKREGVYVLRFEDIAEVQVPANRRFSVVVVNKREAPNLMVNTCDEASQKAFVDAIVRFLPGAREERTMSSAVKLVGPITIGIILCIVGAIVTTLAVIIEAENPPVTHMSGRGALAFLAVIAWGLGVKGSILVFGSLLLPCMFWFVHIKRNQYPLVRWRLA